MDNTDTLLETGLGFTCDFDKAGGFIGIDSVIEQKRAAKENGGLRKRLVQVLLNDPEPLLHHGEVLWRNGERISEIRSASYGFTLGGAVGLSMVEESSVPITKEYVSNAEWMVERGHDMIPCTVSLAPLYDPRNKKVKM